MGKLSRKANELTQDVGIFTKPVGELSIDKLTNGKNDRNSCKEY